MKTLGHIPRQLLATVLCAAGLLTLSATAQAPNDVRIALIIGNSAYPGTMALANPSNDAKDMAATLRNMGFGVIEVLDGNRAQMMEAIERTNKQLQGKQGVGMLFYAGHGLQLDWRNYMVPLDAKLNNAKDVPANTVDIEVVMKAFQSAGNRMNIVVLDACRDDPFANGKTSSGKGLAPLDAPTGTFLAYATAPGNVAQDGTGKNGLYTGFLLQELQKPTARIEDVFKRVRFAVRKASSGAQIPWETTSLEDDFVFNSGIKKVVKLTETQVAKEFDTEKADWDKIKESKNINDYYAFVQKYPTGLISVAAANTIERLNQSKVIAYQDKNGITYDAKLTLLRKGDTLEVVRKDDYTKLEISRSKQSITTIFGDTAMVTGGRVMTLSGATLVEGRDMYDPPRPNLPAEGLAVGRRWESRSAMQRMPGNSGWSEDQGQVMALVDVTVPAGTFKVFQMVQTSSNHLGERSKTISWMLPDFGLPIKRQVEINRRSGNPDRWTEEAVSITRGAS